MRKIIYILFLVLLITGCNENKDINITYDDNYYQVASPYKTGVGNYSIRSYDKNEVDLKLMNLSNNYFKTTNSFYQAGQYLTSSEIKELVDTYNETDEIVIDKVSIKPKYITSIYEQNYLSYNGELKGVSLAIVVSNKQYYDNSYKIVDEEVVLNYAKEKAIDLANYIKAKNINGKIIIGIFLESNNTLGGCFKYIGQYDKDKIDFKYINYNYQSLDSNYVMNNETDTYNSILSIKKVIDNYEGIYLNPIGLYQDKKLVEVNLTFTKGYFKNDEVLYIVNEIRSYLNVFSSDVKVNIYFKNNNDIKAYITRNNNELETYIMEE